MLLNPTTNKPDNLVKVGQVRKYFSVADTTLRRWIERGWMPEPQYLNGVRVWRQSDIDGVEEILLTRHKPEPNNDQVYTC